MDTLVPNLMMKKALNRGLTGLLMVSYCLTIPLLSILHMHEGCAPSNAAAFRSAASASDYSSVHPRACDICSRLHSTLGLVEVRLHEEKIRFERDTLVSSELAPTHTVCITRLQGRAPPFLRA